MPTPSAPAVRSRDDLAIDVERLVAYAAELYQASRSDSTRRAYASDWNDFSSFCERLGERALPASSEVVALYLAHMAFDRELAASTVQRRLSAVTVAHLEDGHESPVHHHAIRQMMTGLRRATATTDTKQKRALSVPELRRIIATLDLSTLRGLRDRSLLLTGFVGGLRRSEIVGSNVGHLNLSQNGYTLRIPKSKTDQEGKSRSVILPYAGDRTLCPAVALTEWLTEAELTRGAVYRRVRRGDTLTSDRLTAQSVALVLKNAAIAADIDPADLAGHSLRSGFATSAASAGASERAIANQTGHRSTQVLRRYIQQASAFDDNAAMELLP